MPKKNPERNWVAITRRSFLQSGFSAAMFSGCAVRPAQNTAGASLGAPAFDDNPIATLPDGPAARAFFGDDPKTYHSVLWDKAGALSSRGGIPADAHERVRVCIVGGGVAGLSAAYLLRDLKPVVLEGAERLGGNAKAHRWQGLTYGIGAAYLTNAPADAEHMKMLSDVGLSWRVDDPTHDKMHLNGVVHPEFWFGGTDMARAKDFRAAWAYFAHVRDKAYPAIPFDPKGALSRDAWRSLDNRSFGDELKRSLGKTLHPHVEDLVRQYCWSSFGSDLGEVSAAAGLSFLASDLGGMFVFQGGNAAISQALVDRLRRDLGISSVRSRARVIDIKRTGDGVRVTFIDSSDHLRTILADTCVVATPKFAARRMIDDLPAAQLDAIAQLKYRSYVVGHLLIDQPRAPDFHDLYCIAGQAPTGPVKEELTKRPFADVVLSTFASGGHPSKTVLNLYRALPYDEGRAELFGPGAYEQQRAMLEPAVPAIVTALGLNPAKVVDLRLSGWGHPLVQPSPGLISGGAPDRASAPHHERIFFAQQDNFALSAFESAFAAAQDARDRVRSVLGS